MKYQAAAVALASLSFCGLAQEPPHPPARSFYSREKEAALGAQLAMQVRRQTTPLKLANVDDYVDKLGRQLAIEMPNGAEDWKFSAIKDREDGSTYEPISLPGGWIFIPAQLFLTADREGEFAGMLAHAMAHVAERQGVRQTPGDVTYLAAIPLVFMGGPIGFGGDGRNSLAPVEYLKRRRQYELEADEVAARSMAAAGYDPNDLVSYIARVQPQHSEAADDLSPLPTLAVRISNLKRVIQTLPASRMRESHDSFQLIKDEVRREEAETATHNQVRRIPSLIHPDHK